MAVAPVRAEQQLKDPITVKITQQPAGRLVVVIHRQKIVAEVGLHVACTGAPQAADLGEQRVVGSIAGRACRIAVPCDGLKVRQRRGRGFQTVDARHQRGTVDPERRAVAGIA